MQVFRSEFCTTCKHIKHQMSRGNTNMFILFFCFIFYFILDTSSRCYCFRCSVACRREVCKSLRCKSTVHFQCRLKWNSYLWWRDAQGSLTVCAQCRLQVDVWRRQNLGGAESRSPIRASVNLPVHSPLRWRKQWKPPLSMQAQMSCENPHARSSNRTTQPSDHRLDPHAAIRNVRSCLHALECFSTDIKISKSHPI